MNLYESIAKGLEKTYGNFDEKHLKEERELSKIEGTIGKTLKDNKDKFNAVSTKEELVRVAKEVLENSTNKDKGRFFKILAGKRDYFSALKYIYDYILKGDGQGVIIESKEYPDLYRDVEKFLASKGYDVNHKDTKTYIDGVVNLLDEAPEDYTLEQWYRETQENYPQDLRALKRTRPLKESSKRDDIDAMADDSKEKAKKMFRKMQDDADADRDYRLKRAGLNESIGSELANYQEYVDYDMKHYGMVSAKTMNILRKNGLSLVKDQYDEYEVIAKTPDHDSKKSLDENKKESPYKYM